jgi:hypothetical protein
MLIRAGEVDMFVTDQGTGLPILFLHGNPDTADMVLQELPETPLRDTPRTEPAISLQVKGQSLEQTHDVPEAIAAPLEHFELIVQPFDKAARLMADEVVGNQILPTLQQLQE